MFGNNFIRRREVQRLVAVMAQGAAASAFFSQSATTLKRSLKHIVVFNYNVGTWLRHCVFT